MKHTIARLYYKDGKITELTGLANVKIYSEIMGRDGTVIKQGRIYYWISKISQYGFHAYSWSYKSLKNVYKVETEFNL